MAWRKVSTSDSVSTSNRLNASGIRSAPMNRNGVVCAKRAAINWIVNTIRKSRAQISATWSEAADLDPVTPAAISAGERPTTPTHTISMNSASGNTRTIDRLSAIPVCAPTSTAAKVMLSAATIARLGSPVVAIVAPIRIKPKATAPLGVIGRGCKVVICPQHRDEVGRRRTIEQGGKQDLQGLVEGVGGQSGQYRRIHELLPGLEEQRDEEG